MPTTNLVVAIRNDVIATTVCFINFGAELCCVEFIKLNYFVFFTDDCFVFLLLIRPRPALGPILILIFIMPTITVNHNTVLSNCRVGPRPICRVVFMLSVITQLALS